MSHKVVRQRHAISGSVLCDHSRRKGDEVDGSEEVHGFIIVQDEV